MDGAGQKMFMGFVALLILLSLWLLLSFLLPGTARFIETRGWGDFLLGYGFMAGPAVFSLGFSGYYMWRAGPPPFLFQFLGCAALIYTSVIAYQFVMY